MKCLDYPTLFSLLTKIALTILVMTFNISHQQSWESGLILKCYFCPSWLPNLPWSYQSYRQLSGVSKLWCLPFHHTDPLLLNQEMKSNLKKNKHATGLRSLKKSSLSLSSLAHLGILHPRLHQIHCCQINLPKSTAPIVPHPQPFCSELFKGSSCPSEGRNCLNSTAWDSEHLIIQH